MTQYIKLTEDHETKNLYSAYFLLGKSYLALGKSDSACSAFQYSLKGGTAQLTREEYVETVFALVEGYIQRGDFVQALDTFEDIHSVSLSQEESIEILLLKSKVLRKIGLIEKAIAILGDRAEYISEPHLKAKLTLELADCHIDKGNFKLASDKLTELLIIAEPGPSAYSIALKLAEVCLQLEQNDQAISVCSQLLALEPTEQVKQEALNMLATAHNQRKDYNKAVLALLGQWK